MISSVTPGVSQQGGSTGLGGLGTDLFLELLIAQMQNQNPLEPMDGAALMQQTSQLANVEAIQAMSELQSHIVGLSQFGNATTMIGRVVQATDPTLGLIEGEVTGVNASPTGPMLQIGSRQVSVDDVVRVLAAPSVVSVEEAAERTSSTVEEVIETATSQGDTS